MNTHTELPFERFRYWPGQLVRARDFTAQLAEAERFSRWHQRAIHNAFGVRFGFDVTLDTSSNMPRVRIECGVAFDCSGAMLVLQRPRTIAIPPLEPRQPLLLVVRSRDAGGACACGCSHAGIGMSPSESGSSLLEHDLAFDWRVRQHHDVGHDVLLARLSRGDGGEIAVDATVRMATRPLARPRLGSGATPGARTPWEPWAAGMQTRIDTSAAGFTRTPSYIASLIATGDPLSFLDTPFFFTHVFDPGPAGFTFRIAAPPIQRASISVESVQLVRDTRKRRFPRLRVVASDEGRRSLAALRAGQTVRLVTPTLAAPAHRAPTATIEQVQADKRQLILHIDDPSGVIGELNESLRIVRLDGDGFQAAFPDLARRLGLMVCWFGCQGLEFASPGCPGQRPLSGHCCDDEPNTATSGEASCR